MNSGTCLTSVYSRQKRISKWPLSLRNRWWGGKRKPGGGEQGGIGGCNAPLPPSAPLGCRLRSIVRLVILLSDEDGVRGASCMDKWFGDDVGIERMPS